MSLHNAPPSLTEVPRSQRTAWERFRGARDGKAGWVLLWLLGVPIPVLLVLFLIRGCT